MAINTRSSAAPTAPPEAASDDLAAIVRVLARMTCHFAVQATRSPHSATFRQIAVQVLRIASHADVDLIEKFLSS